MKALLLGAGASRKRMLGKDTAETFEELVTLDVQPEHSPDVVHDMENLPLPFADETFDEIHAYHVMEHVGRQGDWRFFFAQWQDFYRLLKPGGDVFILGPKPGSVWVWGDPGHTRMLCWEQMCFLHQPNYAQIGSTCMTDYRSVFQGDFDVVHYREGEHHLEMVVRAMKPSRMVAP